MMDKIKRIIVILFLLATFSAKAQHKPFDGGDMVLGVFQATGGKMVVSNFDYISPVKGIVCDLGIIPMDSGYFGIGMSLGTRTQTKHYIYPTSAYGNLTYYDYTWDYKIIETRISYHIDLLGMPFLDTYIGALISYNPVKFSEVNTKYDGHPGMVGYPFPLKFDNQVRYGGMFGMRLEAFNFLGVFGEVSFGIRNFTFGASLKI